MSDINNPKDFDKYGNPVPPDAARPFAYEPPIAAGTTGRAPYILLGILVLVGIVGGALYFNGNEHGNPRRPDVAAAPPAVTDTATPGVPTTPAPAPTGALNTTPAPTATPAPAGPPSTTQQ